ncbi:MAG: hypothetical protein UY48_C0006G0004 [Candidatus Gottesmanbacteria bacterium GW2011_GWB1_49_7]|uniref:Uncharacterized protein n=1 Tax=Candidatus Gottesmanbacteria bacterium GW2011_GWB1_49_7 TaxID=1618448 RepID=A0A0G1W2G8_9BACT|nr:MAG: hypothetical protein UY48_C0006G0004 [Candidatus Gottesmanbacteria bacterium GW2011_GWB1_49_7]
MTILPERTVEETVFITPEQAQIFGDQRYRYTLFDNLSEGDKRHIQRPCTRTKATSRIAITTTQ